MSIVYDKVKEFKKKYPMTVAWRLKSHSKIIDLHLNPGEEVKYVFACQKNNNPVDIITTYVVALTNKRILLGQKRLIFGYFFTAITPDMFNDLQVKMGVIWGKIEVDTVKETVYLSNIQRDALDEIETNITEYMMEEKQKYRRKQ
ncbi:MAG: hypothetical protein E7157_00915 [Lactobacillales bacterium]|nr:hypothetical protein [Lactobacillales bacterium]